VRKAFPSHSDVVVRGREIMESHVIVFIAGIARS